MAILLPAELKSRLMRGERFLSDGGIGTELMARGLGPAEILRANQEHPDHVQAVHRNYLAAGAQCLTSNTFGLMDEGDTEYLAAGWHLAQRIAEECKMPVVLWVSFAPHQIEAALLWLQMYANANTEWQATVLLETCTDLKEACEAVDRLRALSPSLLAVTCHFTMASVMPDGHGPEMAARTLEQAGADIVGANCGASPEDFIDLTARMRAVTTLPLLMQPNAGLPRQNSEGQWEYSVAPSTFAAITIRMLNAGASIVGGCCGTTPAHISAVQRCSFP